MLYCIYLYHNDIECQETTWSEFLRHHTLPVGLLGLSPGADAHQGQERRAEIYDTG